MTRLQKNPAGRNGFPARLRTILLCLVLFGGVVWTFLPVLQNGFVDYDDPDYVTHNFHVQSGFNWDNVRWAFTDTQQAGFWHPLTWLSHMLDCEWFGLNPRGHHLTSLLLHGLNAVLVFLVFKKMAEVRAGVSPLPAGAVGQSFFLAALFALHPLRVESVAWIAERKDVLSALFWLLAMWAYAQFVEKSKAQNPAAKLFYGSALLVFVCGLMSKPMLVTLPFVLLLLDYWPLGRFAIQGSKYRVRDLVLEKIPFFALALGASVVTFLAQKASSATSVGVPMSARLENALVSYCRYLGKSVCPVDLAFFYPHPGAWPILLVTGSGMLLLAVSVFAVAMRRGHPYLPVGWFWFLGTLVPAIGLVQVGGQAMADRFTYLPSLGIFLILIWGSTGLARRFRFPLSPLCLGGAAAIGACIFLTRQQIGDWKDSETLCERALAETKNNYVAHFCLGVAWEEQGRPADAIAEYREAIAAQPDYAPAYNNLGATLGSLGQFDEALQEFAKALPLESNPSITHFGMGVVFGRGGQMQNAVAEFRLAIKCQPDWPEAHYNLGIALESEEQMEPAAAELQIAVALEPGSAKFRLNLGSTLAKLNRQPEAIEQFQRSLQLNPTDVECRVDLGNALARSGRLDEAIGQFHEALKLKPDVAEIRNNLGLALKMRGQINEAAAEFQEALKLKPGYLAAQKNLDGLLGETNNSELPAK